MKSLSFRVTLVAVVACGLTAFCTSPAVAQDAAATYKAKCAMCHGVDGKGGKMGTKDFASPVYPKANRRRAGRNHQQRQASEDAFV